ncbi:hypothetical protein Bca4012_096054 [Brassica carinata]|uniref:Uncharacterized protein n=1 Tax=Brassica carinata TaxID=52824 RepID=A0A8X7PYX5_BRACI|nr:serine/arginine repetitive matrix protein 1 [Brassica napus]KAG2259052.1 hypothetical protein Bca52824_078346 [Brassica carinata]KAG2259053.1 hypothetical protein Bca52824_078347 [Brassica carinata]
MGVAVLQPRDCLTDPLSIRNILHPPPQRPNKPTPNRRRRSPPRRQPETSPPPKGSKKKKKNLNHNHVRIPKRGEEKVPDLRSARQIVSDPVMIPSQSRRSTPALFYAGPVTSTSPPPSEVPLPAFFAKRSVSSFEPADATTDLIRILRLDTA